MPVGRLTREEYEREMNGAKNAPLQNERGRATGDVNVPEALRKIIGETSVIDGRKEALKLARGFGVSASSVSAYAKGATSTASYDTPNKSLLAHLNRSRARAYKRASRTLNSALLAISQEKLDYTDAKDLSVIAKNMSGIIKDLEPPKEQAIDSSAGTPQFIVYAPTFRTEETFEVIDVKE